MWRVKGIFHALGVDPYQHGFVFDRRGTDLSGQESGERKRLERRSQTFEIEQDLVAPRIGADVRAIGAFKRVQRRLSESEIIRVNCVRLWRDSFRL